MPPFVPRFPALRPRTSSPEGVLHSDHRLYHRLPLVPVPPFRYVVDKLACFFVQHDLSRCRPFGLFVVHVLLASGGPQRYVGAQLSYPSHDDCWKLYQRAREAARTHERSQLGVSHEARR